MFIAILQAINNPLYLRYVVYRKIQSINQLIVCRNIVLNTRFSLYLIFVQRFNNRVFRRKGGSPFFICAIGKLSYHLLSSTIIYHLSIHFVFSAYLILIFSILSIIQVRKTILYPFGVPVVTDLSLQQKISSPKVFWI